MTNPFRTVTNRFGRFQCKVDSAPPPILAHAGNRVAQPEYRLTTLWAVVALLVTIFPPSVLAADPVEIRVTPQFTFEPAIITLPAGKKTKLIVHNDANEPEEFESMALNREKIVRPGRKITVFLPPLKPGEYHFFGEFHPETARGKIIVK